jgi:hypothetical protein
MLGDPTANADNANFPAILDIQTKMAVASLACDRTRVATLQWSRSFSPVIHTWVGVTRDHHTISHLSDPQSLSDLHQINRWYGQKVAGLLAQLDAITEGNGTLLDNTFVVWGNEAATGQHDASTAVFVTAGSCGGKFRTGRFVNCMGYDWSQFLVSICHAMGVTSVNGFGDLPMKTGEIPLLF